MDRERFPVFNPGKAGTRVTFDTAVERSKPWHHGFYKYRKGPKISDTWKFAVITLKV